MGREILTPGEEPEESRGFLSQQVEQELRANPLIWVAGVVKGADNDIYLRRPLLISTKDDIPDNKILTSNIDIYCGLKTPVYEPERLQAVLEVLTQIQPSEVKPFNIANLRAYRQGKFAVQPSYDLDLGKAYYEEQLGTITRLVKVSLTPQDTELLKRAGVKLGKLEDESKISVSQRTSVHLYPDENCASWMYEFAKSPQDWKDRKDWYDPGESFFRTFSNRIEALQLGDLREGKNIFWEEESTWD